MHLREGQGEQPDEIIYSAGSSCNAKAVLDRTLKTFSSITRKARCYTITPFVRYFGNTDGYHVGGSLPMKAKPESDTDTNIFGNPKGWKRIHVMDSSVFPSLPGTTIGLLAMANASRIASEVELSWSALGVSP